MAKLIKVPATERKDAPEGHGSEQIVNRPEKAAGEVYRG